MSSSRLAKAGGWWAASFPRKSFAQFNGLLGTVVSMKVNRLSTVAAARATRLPVAA
jgi:hypothetical protein